MGSGASQTTKTKSTSTQTPNAPGWYSQPYQSYAGRVSALGNMDPSQFTTPATANQNSAFGRAALGTGNPTAGAYNATQNELGYTPQNVTAGQLSSADLSPYTNPFQRDVIDATLQEFQNGNALGLNQLRASTPTGAFNGSRQGVAEGQLTSDNARTLASTLAGLNTANFQQAQGAAGQDINNRFAADQFNVNSGLQGANQRLGAANQLANIGMMGANNSRADTQLQADLGGQERAINADNNPYVALINLLQTQGGLLGQIPGSAFVGSTTNQSGTQRTTSDPGLLGTLSTLANIASSFMGNPFAGKAG